MPLSLQLNIFSFFLILAALATTSVSVLLLRREAVASKIFGLLMGVTAIWSFTYGMELMYSTLPDMLFWIKFEYIGVGLIPALWFLFCVTFAGYDEKLTKPIVAAIFVIPVLTLIMVWTNDYHYFHYARVEVDTTSGPIPLLDFTPGIWYWVHTAYFYVLLIWGTYLLLLNFRSADPLFKRQTLTVLLGAVIPWAVNAAYLLGFKPYDHLDLTPFVFTVTGMIIGFGLLQYRLFDIIPVARDRLIQNLSDGVIVLDSTDRVVYCNDAMLNILKYDDSGIIGHSASSVFIDFPEIIQHVHSVETHKLSVEKPSENQDDSKHFEVTITKIEDSTGKKTAKVLLFHDVTTLVHNQIELLSARIKAEESDRLKTAFLANMSHEIRNPMNGIIGFAGFIKDPVSSDSDRMRYASIIEKNAQHLMNIINDIIDISKIESGHDKLILDAISISELMNDLSVFFNDQANQKNLDLNFASSVSSSNDFIIIDPQKLRQILVNIINNAIKFTEEGSVTVRVKKLKNQLIFTIKDTGIGIEPDEINGIFERFKQSFDSKRKSFGGTGLGLSISKAYTNLLEGELSVESELQKGSTFTLKIPHFPAEKTELKNDDSDMKDKNFVEPDWSGRTILIAEDEPVNMMYIKIALKNTKATLIAAETGLEAVNAFENNDAIDLILMDIKMPEMDGFEASTIIRKKDSTIPIIALSGHAMVEQKKLDQSGFTGLISKPVKKIDLIMGVNKWISKI
ncbi:MAG TPA: hypothetical protein DCE78_12680 [Bacteroidetes bacterium]|nr:hypothetical protein [Bacteroidota bacterium]